MAGKANKSFDAKPLTGLQRMLCDLHREAKHYWLIPFWTEVNLKRVAAQRRTQAEADKEKVTYTAYVVKAIADTIREQMSHNPEFNAAIVGFPWRRMVCFKNIDAAVAVERRCEGEDYFFVGIIRDADRKSLKEISRELKALKDSDNDDADGFAKEYRLMKMPGLLRRIALWAGRNFAPVLRKYRGTFFVTSVGKYGVNVFPMTNHNLSFSFGEVADRPVADGGEVKVAPATTLTFVYDHRAMVGVPAARLLARVRERLERVEFQEGD